MHFDLDIDQGGVMKLRRIQDLDMRGKDVLLRLDLNVPMKGDEITDETRINAALPTIEYVAKNSRRFAICSHLGRPKGQPDPKYSLEPVGSRLAEILDKEVVFFTDYATEPTKPVLDQMTESQFMLLENLRFHPGEKLNDVDFSRRLAAGFDCYVDDAFGTVHRSHASVVGVTKGFEPDRCVAGFLIQKETEVMEKLISAPKAPFTVVMGGAKVSDKIAVILKLLDVCNNLLIGGAMAYTFLKFNGASVGSSRVEDDCFDLVESIYSQAEKRNVRITLPCDHTAASEFSETSPAVEVNEKDIPPGLMGLDIGPKTIEDFSRVIKASGTVFWNGPMGVFEWPEFSLGSCGIAKAMAESSAETIVGGGDSVAAVNQVGLAANMSHISTGGGASLEFLEGKALPGLRVLAF